MQPLKPPSHLFQSLPFFIPDIHKKTPSLSTDRIHQSGWNSAVSNDSLYHSLYYGTVSDQLLSFCWGDLRIAAACWMMCKYQPYNFHETEKTLWNNTGVLNSWAIIALISHWMLCSRTIRREYCPNAELAALLISRCIHLDLLTWLNICDYIS